LLDLWALVWPLVAVRPEADIFTPSACARYVVEHDGQPHRVLDREVAPSQFAGPLGRGAPLAMVLGIEAVRGYTPLDILRFKEYLRFIGDSDRPLRAFEEVDGFEETLTYPVIGNFPLTNKPLLDLLGVRYLLQPADWPQEPSWEKLCEDSDARAFDFVAGGMRAHPYTLYRNPDVLPRAFVVPSATRLPDREHILYALKSTDFRRTVLLEGDSDIPPSSATGTYRPAQIVQYQPNRVVVEVSGDEPGYLVLADVWFPGWKATVDGKATHVYQANYLFRAVAVPGGTREVVFTFEPESYYRGRWISIAALAVVGALGLLSCWRRMKPLRG
jgi:hypothetical protein